MSTDTTGREELKHAADSNNVQQLSLPDTNDAQNQSHNKQRSEGGDNKVKDDDRIAKIAFRCTSCDLREMVHYFGKQPPFVCGVEFSEDTYVMRDPFQPPIPSWKSKAEYFIAIGAHCINCDKAVCKDSECSFYYTGTYCLQCVRKFVSNFPLDVQQKLKKIL